MVAEGEIPVRKLADGVRNFLRDIRLGRLLQQLPELPPFAAGVAPGMFFQFCCDHRIGERQGAAPMGELAVTDQELHILGSEFPAVPGEIGFGGLHGCCGLFHTVGEQFEACQPQ